MSNGPSTPSSTGRSSNALGRFLNKLRTPTATDSPSNQHDEQPSRPPSRASSPFGSLIGRRSTSRASVRTFDSQASAMPAPPPFPASLNNSSLSLASSSRYPSLDTHDDADLSFPEFETNPFGLSPSTTSLASSHAGGQQHYGAADSAGDATLQARPPPIVARPGTSMSTRSRAESAVDEAVSSRGYSTSSGAAQKESLGLSSRSFGKSLLGKRKEATDMSDAAAISGEAKVRIAQPFTTGSSADVCASLSPHLVPRSLGARQTNRPAHLQPPHPRFRANRSPLPRPPRTTLVGCSEPPARPARLACGAPVGSFRRLSPSRARRPARPLTPTACRPPRVRAFSPMARGARLRAQVRVARATIARSRCNSRSQLLARHGIPVSLALFFPRISAPRLTHSFTFGSSRLDYSGACTGTGTAGATAHLAQCARSLSI